MGETDYTKLSSNLGACYYPAGHIWHYFPVVWLHLNNENAITIMRLVHNLLHQVTLVVVVKIAYIYFAEKKENCDDEDDGYDYTRSSRAQLMAFAFLSSNRDREMFSLMFNDQIMLLYLVLAIYSYARNRPF